MNGLVELLDQMAAEDARSSEPKLDPEDEKMVLKNRLELLNRKEVFKLGDFVKQKEGLDTRNSAISIVVELLEDPVFDTTKGSGTTFFREPLDMVVGELSNGIFVLYHVDSRRFTHA